MKMFMTLVVTDQLNFKSLITAKLSLRVTSISSFYWYLSQQMTLSQFTFLFQFLCEAANNTATFCKHSLTNGTKYNIQSFHKKLCNNLVITEERNEDLLFHSNTQNESEFPLSCFTNQQLASFSMYCPCASSPTPLNCSF